jgi:hypothetical protein
MAGVPTGPQRRAFTPPKSTGVSNWERHIFVLALVVILVIGGIAGLRSLVSLVP